MIKIKIGMGSCGIAAGANDLYQILENKKEKYDVVKTSCIGLCFAEPIVEVFMNNESKLYGYVGKDELSAILVGAENGCFINENVIERDIFDLQKRIVLRNC